MNRNFGFRMVNKKRGGSGKRDSRGRKQAPEKGGKPLKAVVLTNLQLCSYHISFTEEMFLNE